MFFRPTLGPEEEAEVIDTLRSGWLTRGPKTERFERAFAQYIGSRHAIALHSCTAGLNLSLRAAGVGPGDEVITTPITFAATASAIVHAGARPVFADVNPETLNIDPLEAERCITPQTKVLLPVHLYGQPCEMDGLLSIARKHGITVVEDAAHAVGAEYRGKKIGTLGPFTSFSFYATKNLVTGEGGMVTTEDDAQAARIRIWSQQGLDRDAWSRQGPEGYRHWSVVEAGFKYNMSDIQASLGLHQLPRLEGFWKRREEIVRQYDEAFESMPQLSPIHHSTRGPVKSALHLYAVVLKTETLGASRDEVVNAIQRENINVGVHYRALHLQPFFRRTYGFREGLLPKAEYASDRLFCLPLYQGMTDDDVNDVIAAVGKVVKLVRRKP